LKLVTYLRLVCQILHPQGLILLSVLFLIFLLLVLIDSLGILLLENQVLQVYLLLPKEGEEATISLHNLVFPSYTTHLLYLYH
jgi:hypothetical protein